MPGLVPGMTEFYLNVLRSSDDLTTVANLMHRPAIASFFAVVPKARSANAAVDACGIPDGFSNAGAIISMSCPERSQEGSSKCRRNSTSAGS
jgi:hypothetical protein